jgi:beta-glucanase (GH16 family)
LIRIVKVSSVLLVALLFLPCCKKDDQGVAAAPPAPADTIAVLPGWQLVWHDEFNGPSIDQTKWNFEVNGDGGGNSELQYYTARASNAYIDNGQLVIEALQENYLGKSFTSARMNSNQKGDWTYGRFEARAKLPYGQGLWPAIWMLPTDWVYGGWPASGEIDIMELLGQETTKIYGTIHYGSSPATHQQAGGSFVLSSGSFAGTFHLFAVEWDTVGFRWFVDGTKYFETAHGSPFDKRFHLMLNVAVGGNWPGSPDASTIFPQKMFVDYVRVYRKI